MAFRVFETYDDSLYARQVVHLHDKSGRVLMPKKLSHWRLPRRFGHRILGR